MKKKVSLARALKEKNRIAGRLAQSRALVAKENSKVAGATRDVDVKVVYEGTKALRDRLVAIKSAIAIANSPIVSKIIELEEVKGEIAYLKKLNVENGMVVMDEQRFPLRECGKTYEVSAVIRQGDVLAELSALKKRAEELQDELDEFNISTTVEIEVD